jgi:hypothetical protein
MRKLLTAVFLAAALPALAANTLTFSAWQLAKNGVIQAATFASYDACVSAITADPLAAGASASYHCLQPITATGQAAAPVDTDGDGIPDSSDACPTQYASTATGCPVVTTPPPPTSSGAVILEDGSGLRLNGEGSTLWSPYLGEDGGQTYSFTGGTLRVNVPSGQGAYVHFVPRGGSGYNWPGGYAQAYVESGTFQASTNRMTFMVKSSVGYARRADGGPTMEVGTYIRSKTDTNVSNQGAHYYHLLDPNVPTDVWMQVTINGTPQHQVGMSPSTNWPTQSGYFDKMTRFYFDANQPSSVWSFGTISYRTVTGEPDGEVSSVVSYYAAGAYQVSWAAKKNIVRSFTVRYSLTRPASCTSGTSAGTVSSPGNTYTGTNWRLARTQSDDFYVTIQPAGFSNCTLVRIPRGMGAGFTG